MGQVEAKQESGKRSREFDIESPPQATEKKRRLVLHCGHPNSVEEVQFEVVEGDSGEGFKVRELLDNDNFDVLHTIRTSAEAEDKNYSLDFTSSDLTLKKWLCSRVDRFCTEYRNWGVLRPSEETRQLIRGILFSVCQLHQRGQYHGALHNTENYGIRFESNMEKAEDRAKITVKFLYENMSSPFSQPQNINMRQGQENDIGAVTDVIFGVILPTTVSTPLNAYPSDLQDLHQMLNAKNVSTMEFIANHSSLWHWNQRFHYFDKLQKRKKFANHDTKIAIDDAMNNANSIQRPANWHSMVPQNVTHPLNKVFKENYYSREGQELSRFIRIVGEHVSDDDEDNPTQKYYFDSTTPQGRLWLNRKYVDCQITKFFPTFLLEVYKNLYPINIYE